jgi:hypothetical protein
VKEVDSFFPHPRFAWLPQSKSPLRPFWPSISASSTAFSAGSITTRSGETALSQGLASLNCEQLERIRRTAQRQFAGDHQFSTTGGLTSRRSPGVAVFRCLASLKREPRPQTLSATTRHKKKTENPALNSHHPASRERQRPEEIQWRLLLVRVTIERHSGESNGATGKAAHGFSLGFKPLGHESGSAS